MKKTSKLLSLLLCCVLLLSLLPMSVLAVDNAIAFSVPMEKIIDNQSSITPPEATYTFVLDIVGGLADYGVFVTENTASVTTDRTAEWNLTGEIAKSSVNTVGGWESAGANRFYQVFMLTEAPGNAEGCIYSNEIYYVTITVDLAENKADVEIHSGTAGSPTVDKASFTNTFVELNTFSIPVEKTVALDGNTAPGQETFTFELDPMPEPSAEPRSLEDYGITVTEDSIDTDGEGTFSGSLTGTIDPDMVNANNGWREYRDNHYICYLELTEKNDGAEGWSYSDATYAVDILYDAERRVATVETHIPNNDVYMTAAFTNTYTENTYSFDILIMKAVVQGGSLAPGKETFTFDVELQESQPDQNATAAPQDPNFTWSGYVETDGEGVFGGVLTITVPTEEDLNNLLWRGLIVTEHDDGKPGWTYDRTRWLILPMRDEYGYVYCQYYNLTEGEEPDPNSNEGYIPRNGIDFINTYTRNPVPVVPSVPQLNKEDHFAFLQGYPDGSFGPERNMTRAEVTVMFARLITEQMEAGRTYTSSFSDVPADAWYADYIGYMEQFGIVKGYTDGTFRPNAPITRAEFAAIACRFEELTEGAAAFTDVPASHWAARYINFAATRGWVTGYTDGSFHPDEYITRAQVAAVTCRLLERSADQSYVEANYGSLPRTFSDVDSGHWAFWYVMESTNGHDYTKSGTAETWEKTYR